MSLRRWRYFWGCFFLIGLLLFIAGVVFIYLQPKVYESRTVFETGELYPGEDLTLPEPPEGITVRQLAPSTLFEIRATDVDPLGAANAANDFVDVHFDKRRAAAYARSVAEQAATEEGSPEWRALELQRRQPLVPGIVYESAEVSSKPSRPDVNSAIAFTFAGATVFALMLAAAITGRRADREEDGAIISWAMILQRFRKVAPVVCGIYLIWSAGMLLQQPPGYTATATIELMPGSSERFDNRMAILRSEKPANRVVREIDFSQELLVATEREAIDHLMSGLEVDGDREHSTAQIRYSDYSSGFASKIPSAIASAYANLTDLQTLRRFEQLKELKAHLQAVDPDSPMAGDIRAAEANLAAESESAPRETAKVTATTPAAPLPRDWAGWILGYAWLEILRGCAVAAAIAFASLLLFNGERKTKEERQRAKDERRLAIEASADPY